VSGGTYGVSASANDVMDMIREEGVLDLDQGFGPDDDLFEAGLDSLALMQVLVAARVRFGVIIEAGDVTKNNFRTAESVARLLRQDSV
jgi:acyl carrier protein